MSRMGNSRRAEITRGKLDQARAAARASFAAACRTVGAIVAAAVPAQAAERNRAEWVSVVEAVTAIAASCHSLQQLEARIAEQSAALRAVPENAVVLSTIHSAKGLEWDAVFMVAMEEGLLPHAGNDDLEEERRVAYVGITRAKRLLGLTYATTRFAHSGAPSTFLSELAGRAPHHYVWTRPHANSAEERLPLLSNGERKQLANGRLRRGPPDRPARSDGNGAAARHGKPWSSKEERGLRVRFMDGESIAELARAHQRKQGAIIARLVKLGLIEAPNELEGFIR
jgi:ATP-dependent exoDNAse (exonuclease V) beta subunit